VRDTSGNIKSYAGIAEDITERKWAERERVRLAAIIEHSDDAIVSITLDGTVIAWNHGAERKYGFGAAEIIGRSIFVLIPPDHRPEYLEVMERVKNGESVPSYDTVRMRKDGTLLNFSIGISAIEAHDGSVVGASKVSHDISRVRKLEAQLIEAQKMEVLGHLTGGIAHDFNNILAIVLGHSELMLQAMDAQHPLRRHATAVFHAAKRGAGLTRQLLVFGRKETVLPTVLDLNEALRSMDGMLRQLISEDIELTVMRGTQIGRVKVDEGYIGQLLMNLVINARDAMPNGGKLLIATSNCKIDKDNVADHPDVPPGDYVILNIGDNGIGMSEEIKARLFEPFFTTKPRGRGTGLGLTTCQTIVQQSGGHLTVDSEVGKGTSFKIYFPRVLDESHLAVEHLESMPPPRGNETLLVVEDEPAVRRLVCLMLQAQGYHVLTASNGEEGLATVLNDKRSKIRLIISDVIMPNMGGKAMSGHLKTRKPGLRILFTSGHLNDPMGTSSALYADIAFLSKPYSLATLAWKVRELLDAPTGVSA
jgi:PAS domain S-box-containing protein